MSVLLDPRNSLFISLASGVGLIAIVAIAPLRDSKRNAPETTKQADKNLLPAKESDTLPEKYNPFRRALDDSFKKDSDFLLNLRVNPKELREYSDPRQKFREFIPGANLPKLGIRDIYNFRSNKGLQVYRFDLTRRESQYSDDFARLDTSISGSPRDFQVLQNPHWGRFMKTRLPYNSSMIPNLDYLDIQIPISKSVSAVFSASTGDPYVERAGQMPLRNYAFAGVSFHNGKFLNSRFLAGDRNFSVHTLYQHPASFPGSTSVQEFRRMGYSEREVSGLRSFEWQTNLQPSKSVRMQTAFSSNPDWGPEPRQSQQGLPNSGRFSLFLGEKHLILNLKYSYQMSEPYRQPFFTQWKPSQDAASLGLIFFLDPTHTYSLYLGGSQFQVAERAQGRRQAQESGNSENISPYFTATFRGKAGRGTHSHFFVNFQNQPAGLWGIGMPNPAQASNMDPSQWKSLVEYATILGLELDF